MGARMAEPGIFARITRGIELKEREQWQRPTESIATST